MFERNNNSITNLDDSFLFFVLIFFKKFNKVFQSFEINSMKKIDIITNPNLLHQLCLELLF